MICDWAKSFWEARPNFFSIALRFTPDARIYSPMLEEKQKLTQCLPQSSNYLLLGASWAFLKKGSLR